MGPKRILIVKLSSIGDIVHAIPFVRVLRKHMPDAYIAWALQVGEELLCHDHDINTTINIGRGKGFTGGIRWAWDVRNILRSYEFDIAVDLQGLAKSGLIVHLSGAGEKIGFKGNNCREMNWAFTTHRYSAPENEHVVFQNCALLRHFGIVEPEIDIPGIATSRENDECALEFLEEYAGKDGPYAVFAPGASRDNKRWPEQNYARLFTLFSSKTGWKVFLTAGNERENDLCNAICDLSEGPDRPVRVPRLDLGQFASLVKRASLFVGSDSGPAHIAYAAGIPTVMLFGPTGPWRNGAYDAPSGKYTHVTGISGCIECRERTCSKSYSCMQSITPESVMEAAMDLLGRINEVPEKGI